MTEKIERPSVSRREFLKTMAIGAGGVALGGTIAGCATRYEEVGPELVVDFDGQTVLELTQRAYPGAYDIHWEPTRGSIQIDQIRGYDRGPYQYMVDGEVIGDGERADAGNSYAVDQYRLRRGQRLQWVRTVA